MKIIADIKKRLWFFVIATGLLFLSMTVNVMGVVSTKYLHDRNANSESMFGNQIVCGGDAYGGFLLKSRNRGSGERQLETCEAENIAVYTSTFNLIGRLYAYPYTVASKFTTIDPFLYIKFAIVLNAVLVAAILAIFLVWVRVNFGSTTSIVVLLLTASSPQLIMNSVTIIAHYNAMNFVLLIYALYYYRAEATRKYRAYFWLLLAIFFCLKALTSYEYITSYMAMVAAVVVYYLWIQRATTRVYFKELLFVVLFCSVGLVAALGVHASSIAAQEGADAQGVDVIKNTLIKRTTGNEVANESINPYRNLRELAPEAQVAISEYIDLDKREAARALRGEDTTANGRIVDGAVSGVTYLLLPVASFPIALKEPLATYVQSFAFFLILLLLLWSLRKKWVRRKSLSRKVEALYLGLAISFVGYLSWQVLAYNHSIHHPHINGYTMYIPFALMGYIVIGLFIDSLIEKRKIVRDGNGHSL